MPEAPAPLEHGEPFSSGHRPRRFMFGLVLLFLDIDRVMIFEKVLPCLQQWLANV